MNVQLFRHRPGPLLCVLVALVLITVVPAFAQESSADPGAEVRIVPPPGPEFEGDAPEAAGQLRVVGSAFRPRANDVSYTTSGPGGCSYVTAGNAGQVWNTPLYLENGAVVNTLRIYVDDTNALNLQAWFTVYDLFGNIVTEYGGTSSGINGQNWFDVTGINHTINYSIQSYVVNFRPNGTGSTLQFCGARIFYTY